MLKVLTEFCQFHAISFHHSQTRTKLEGQRHCWDENKKKASFLAAISKRLQSYFAIQGIQKEKERKYLRGS